MLTIELALRSPLAHALENPRRQYALVAQVDETFDDDGHGDDGTGQNGHHQPATGDNDFEHVRSPLRALACPARMITGLPRIRRLDLHASEGVFANPLRGNPRAASRSAARACSS